MDLRRASGPDALRLHTPRPAHSARHGGTACWRHPATGIARRGVLAAGLPPLCGCAGLPATGGERHTTRPAAAQAPPAEERARLERLVASYPDHLAGIQDDWLLWSDGARVPIGAGQPPRRFEEMLRNATIADQLRQRYAPGPLPAPPPRDHSPGRLRNAAFFARMYGECRQGATQPLLRPVTWMPRSRPQRLNVTTVNGIATRLERVIEALEALPDPVRAYLVPSPGAFACRSVADTGQPSMHAYGAAIDIAVRHADYWLWARSADEPIHRNRIPAAIVEAFEAERFIWGGKWYHYDTMHFEYRPELFEA